MAQRATEGEIAEMVKLLKKKKVKNLDYKYDSGDSLGFVSAYLGSIWLQYQDRQGTPMFASFLVGDNNYEISYPKGKLLELLKTVTEKAKESRMIGKTFLEKVKALNLGWAW